MSKTNEYCFCEQKKEKTQFYYCWQLIMCTEVTFGSWIEINVVSCIWTNHCNCKMNERTSKVLHWNISFQHHFFNRHRNWRTFFRHRERCFCVMMSRRCNRINSISNANHAFSSSVKEPSNDEITLLERWLKVRQIFFNGIFLSCVLLWMHL